MSALLAVKMQEGHVRISAARPSPQSSTISVDQLPEERPVKSKAPGMLAGMAHCGEALLLLPLVGDRGEKMRIRMPIHLEPPPMVEMAASAGGVAVCIASVMGSSTASVETDEMLSSFRRMINTTERQRIAIMPVSVQKPPSGVGSKMTAELRVTGLRTEKISMVVKAPDTMAHMRGRNDVLP